MDKKEPMFMSQITSLTTPYEPMFVSQGTYVHKKGVKMSKEKFKDKINFETKI